VTYTAKDAFKWLDKNTSYSYSGEYDAKRQKYGWTVLEGYEYEYLVSAMKKYSETDRESYFVCHTRAPTEKNTLEDKREGMLNSFESLEDNLKKVFEYYQLNGKFPWNVEGFLPQDHKNKENNFIRV
jgi:hypothetical protein